MLPHAYRAIVMVATDLVLGKRASHDLAGGVVLTIPADLVPEKSE